MNLLNKEVKERKKYQVKRYKCMGILIYSVIKTPYYKKILLLGVPIWWHFSVSLQDFGKKIMNNLLISKELFDFVKENRSKKIILFIVEELAITGGVEVRLSRYVKKFQELGWKCVLIVDKNDSDISFDLSFQMGFYFKNFSSSLLKLIKKINPSLTEFHFKGADYLSSLDIRKMQTITKVGGCIHGIVDLDVRKIKSMDYSIVSNYGIIHKNPELESCCVIKNSIECMQSCWKYRKQKKAIMITRVSSDKWPTIENFIKLCRKFGYRFEIAGYID